MCRALVLHAETVGVVALSHCTELGHVVIEFRNHVIPEVVCRDGFPVHEIVFIVEEGLDRLIFTQELKHTS